MAFRKHAKALVVHPRVSQRAWEGLRGKGRVASKTNLTAQAAKILGGSLDPDKWLFSHCSIVASVDTELVPGVKLGKIRTGSSEIQRSYGDYHITPESQEFVNSNGDSWSRPTLLAAYPTFVGGQNYVEHVQILEQSKGRILDAVARDTGPSIYVDILVATNRKHTQLIKDIVAEELTTLSMGCTTAFTVCTKCGNVAADETELCDCIRYNKLNTFLDDRGQKRVIAELCGHPSYLEDPKAPAGVQFIEASWVKVPAFKGAVLRNILDPMTFQGKVVATEATRIGAPVTTGSGIGSRLARAPSRTRFQVRAGEEAVESEEPETPWQDPMAPNDSLQREARRLNASLEEITRRSLTAAELVNGAAEKYHQAGLQVSVPLWRAILANAALHSSPVFRSACEVSLNRPLTSAELRVVVRVGAMLAKASDNNPTSTR